MILNRFLLGCVMGGGIFIFPDNILLAAVGLMI